MVNKKLAKARKEAKKQANKHKLPFVSVCTPTFNRRPFIPYAIKNYLTQDYPNDRMEWIIIDDGTDPIEDLVKDISGVKYFHYTEKMPLGKKRNLMHKKSKGDIIVYMDDDDFYPSDRVSHAVEKLTRHQDALCAGSSCLYIWFKHNEQMYRFGPYGPNHATAGTFAFKRELLKITSYEETAALAEEKHFLKNYTIPFVQLDPTKTILVFSHDHNTFDKRKLLESPNPKYVNSSTVSVDHFIKDVDTKNFFTNKVNDILKTYEPGLPKHKPDVIKQTQEIEKQRKKMMEDNAPKVTLHENGVPREVSLSELSEIFNQQNNKNTELKKLLQQLNHENNLLKQKLNDLTIKYKELNDKINQTNNLATQQEDSTKQEQQEDEPETITLNLSEID